jgi:pimeloyl-ACP methyl ester carboxylesterase
VLPALTVPSSDGVTVAVHDLGGDGPPLVVCHATGFNGGAYGPFARHLHPHRHVWALDFRGHGSSTPPDGAPDAGFGWDRVVDDLVAVLDHPELGGGPFDLVGHSMGGAVIAMAELGRPGTVRSAYLFEPIIAPPGFPPGDAGGENPMAAAARRRRPTFPSKAAALWNYASKPPLGDLSASSLAAYVQHAFTEEGEGGMATLHPTPDHEAAVFNGAGKVTVDEAAALTIPVTVAVGTTDIAFGPAHFAGPIAEALPHGRLSAFPDLGHFGPLEAPGVVAADVLAHLARVA